MTGLHHSCGRPLPDQPRVIRWRGRPALEASCGTCRETTRVTWERVGTVAVPVPETVRREARR